MELNHPQDTMPGTLLTVTLFVLSVALDIFSAAAGFDKTILQPVLHVAQILAALTAVVVGACTISPALKHRVKNFLNI